MIATSKRLAAAADGSWPNASLADPVRLRLLTWVADAPDTTACACHLGRASPRCCAHLVLGVVQKLLIGAPMSVPP
jgi:hypothetical protein